MSCYFRHLTDILEEAGITVTKENRRDVDRAFHQAVGIAYKDCPAAWKKIKSEVLNNRDKRLELVKQLRIAMR